MAVFNFVCLLLAWASGEYIGERTWFTTLVAYCPPLLPAIPTVPLLLVAFMRRDRVMTAWSVLGAVFALTVLMGLHVPRWPKRDSPDGPRLRVLTYNIQCGMKGVDKVAAFIRAQDADVVCLQEVTGFGAPDPYPGLCAALPEYRIVRFAETAVATRLPVRAICEHPLISNTWRRAATEVEVEVDGKPVSIVSVHLATAARPRNLTGSWKNLPGYLRHTTQVRALQVDRLLAATANYSHPVIVCGDFNTPPRGRLYSRLTDRWEDAFAVQGLGYGYTYSNKKPLLRIDYIYTGNGARAVHAGIPAARVSDHRPVVAEIALP
jgi:vancomycin resistance protein VanJ